MREALRGLTTRGRSLPRRRGRRGRLARCILGEKDLLRVAVLLAALPLLAAAYVGRSRYRLACTRSLDPHRVPVGASARVLLRLQNLSRLPTGTLLLEDRLPYALGSRPRLVLERLGAQQASSVAYTVRAEVRGRYEVGPLVVRLTDPFGLCELTRSFPSADRLTVIPQVVAAAAGPPRRRVRRQRRQPGPLGGRARRGRRGDPGVPPRRRPAPGALALHRPHRRADGAPRGAAVGEPGHGRARHPRGGAPRRGPDGQLRVGGLGRRQHRGAPAPGRLQAAPGHRRRRRPRRHRGRRRRRCCSTTSPRSKPRPARRHRHPGRAGPAARRRRPDHRACSACSAPPRRSCWPGCAATAPPASAFLHRLARPGSTCPPQARAEARARARGRRAGAAAQRLAGGRRRARRPAAGAVAAGRRGAQQGFALRAAMAETVAMGGVPMTSRARTWRLVAAAAHAARRGARCRRSSTAGPGCSSAIIAVALVAGARAGAPRSLRGPALGPGAGHARRPAARPDLAVPQRHRVRSA